MERPSLKNIADLVADARITGKEFDLNQFTFEKGELEIVHREASIKVENWYAGNVIAAKNG